MFLKILLQEIYCFYHIFTASSIIDQSKSYPRTVITMVDLMLAN